MLPKPLYEAAPFLYIILGIAATALIDSYVSALSGFLLIMAGCVIVYLRDIYRSSRCELKT